jgi:anti-sigma factor RsiW
MKRRVAENLHLTADPAGLLMRYLDGEVGARERGRIERHLADCRACRAEVRTYRALFGAVRRMPARRAPAHLAGGILAAVAADRARRRPAFPARWIELAGGVYAAVAVGALVALGFSPWRDDLVLGMRRVASGLLAGSVNAVVATFDQLITLLDAAVRFREAARGLLEPLAPLWRTLGILAELPELRVGLSLALVLTTALWWMISHRQVGGPGRMKDASAFL